MENIQESKNIISEAKNICLIPSEAPEAATSALALFYTLKEMGKNVNLIDSIPENLKFLTPSLDFISYPKNFVISIPNRLAEISQVYYEKDAEALKVFLTVENGKIKKEDVSFYFSETKPDLVITFGIKDYLKELQGKLNSFGFLLDSPILNIDSSADSTQDTMQENKKFGKINIVKESSLTQTVFEVIKGINANPIKKELAECLLSGVIIHTENFRKNLSAEIFDTSSVLMKTGADLKKIIDNLKI